MKEKCECWQGDSIGAGRQPNAHAHRGMPLAARPLCVHLCNAVDKIMTPSERQTFTLAGTPICTGLQEIKPEGKYVGWLQKVLLGIDSAENKKILNDTSKVWM